MVCAEEGSGRRMLNMELTGRKKKGGENNPGPSGGGQAQGGYGGEP